MGHWYKPDGTTCHTVINKAQTAKQNKDRAEQGMPPGPPVMRDTNLGDAKRMGLYCGWTAIGSLCRDSKGLEDWKKNEMWKIILANERGSLETDQRYKQRINKLLDKELGKYAKLGTRVHKAIEEFLDGDSPAPSDPVAASCLQGFLEWHDTTVCQVLHSEQTFCSPEWGYGGTIDLQWVDHDENFCITDFKTKHTTEGRKIVQGLEQKRQLVAYALGIGKIMYFGGVFGPDGYFSEQLLDLPRLGNLFLSTTEPGRWEYHEVDPEEVPELILDVRDATRLWHRENSFIRKG